MLTTICSIKYHGYLAQIFNSFSISRVSDIPINILKRGRHLEYVAEIRL